ncbi:MAG: glycogen-binding domain-containing protein [Gemmatimonadales bacterium]
MTDELPPNDPLLGVVGALREGTAPRHGLVDRTRRRARRARLRARLSTAAGTLAIALVAVVLLRPREAAAGQITFALNVPASSGVSLVGDFTEWETDRVRLTPAGGDRWEVTLQLPPGRYRFAYVTDGGEWLPDPDAAPVPDDFGRPTSVLTVPTP